MARINSAHQYLQTLRGSQTPRNLWLGLMEYSFKSRESRSSHSSDEGLTLIECLVAMIIITVVVAIITPPIFLAVGTRVNNRRTEQALQVAQDEIERVRLLMTGVQSYAEIEPQLPPVAGNVARNNLRDAKVPQSVCDKAGPPPLCNDAEELFLAFGSGEDDPSALYVQTFRDKGVCVEKIDEDNKKFYEVLAFNMGVRVYSNEAVNDVSNIDESGEAASINFTSGTKQRGSRPLVVMYTEMARSTERDALTRMKDYTEGAGKSICPDL